MLKRIVGFAIMALLIVPLFPFAMVALPFLSAAFVVTAVGKLFTSGTRAATTGRFLPAVQVEAEPDAEPAPRRPRRREWIRVEV